MGSKWEGAGLLAATTIGAGIFTLPYMTVRAGWGTAFFYLVILSALLIYAHGLYARTLNISGQTTLTGAAGKYLGPMGAALGVLAVVGGLLLTLLVYIILATRFISVLLPAINPAFIAIGFWFLGSLPIFLNTRRLSWLETLGVAAMALIIVIIAVGANDLSLIFKSPAATGEIFLPFGHLLFALAAWTAVPPILELEKKNRQASIAWGTVISAILYAIFILAIVGSASLITPDTLSGLTAWPGWKVILLIIFGLFAIWTSYVPIGREAMGELHKNLPVTQRFSGVLVIGLPIIFFLLGATNVVAIVGLAGGIFVALQYILIAWVGRKAAGPSLYTWLIVPAFLLGMVYEIYNFVIH